MAKFILTNAYVLINSVDLSDHVESVELKMAAADVDVTAMGATAKQHMPGLRDDSLTVNFFGDFGSSAVDATLYPLFNGGSLFAVKLAAQGSSISATNPSWSGSAYLLTYAPIAGKVGDAAMVSVDFAMQGAFTRGTT